MKPEPPNGALPPRPPAFRFWAIVVACSVPAAQSTVLGLLAERRAGHETGFSHVFASTGFLWYTWVLFTPLVVRAIRYRPLVRPLSGRVIALHIGLLNAINIVFLGIRGATRWWFGMPLGSFIDEFIDWLAFNLLAYAAVAGMAQALIFASLARQQEIERAVLAEQLAQAQLDALRMQLHPHFLFNALNTIAMLVRDRDAEMAVRLIAELGDILRQLLRGSAGPAIPLRAELDLLKRYLSIEQVRFGDRMAVEWHIDEEVLDAAVPTLILQPVVENAIRHGISLATSVGSLGIGATRRGQSLVLTVSDNGPGGPLRRGDVAEDPDEPSGIGLANTQTRLQKLYGHEAYIRLFRTGGVTFATIVLPLELSSTHRGRTHHEDALNEADAAATAIADGANGPRR